MDHLKVCREKGKQCNKCGLTGHFGKVCKRNSKQNHLRQLPRRANWVEEHKLEDEENDDNIEQQYVLGKDESGSTPFMMKGKYNQKKICLMIDSGSPGHRLHQS